MGVGGNSPKVIFNVITYGMFGLAVKQVIIVFRDTFFLKLLFLALGERVVAVGNMVMQTHTLEVGKFLYLQRNRKDRFRSCDLSSQGRG